MTNDLLSAALGYAARGWHVFPCAPKRKVPITPHGLKDASADGAQIHEWWRTWAQANIGIACAPSGLIVLDSDPRHGGDVSLRALFAELGSETFRTVSALTGGGGSHMYFRADGLDISDSAGVLGPGLDTKRNGYVVAPPSVHPRGGVYTWAEGYAPEDLELAPFPAALLERLASARRAPWAASLPADAAPIPEGGRNAALASLAGTMRRRGMGQPAIEAALLAENTARCRPPLSETEVRAIAASMSRYAPGSLAVGVAEPDGDEPPSQDWGELCAAQPEDVVPAFGAVGATAPEAEGCASWLDVGKVLGPIAWAWERWLAPGFLHLLAGESGRGKSALALRIAACYLNGEPWPDGSAFAGERGAVLWCESEGAQALNLERAGRWGLPIESILVPSSDPLLDVRLSEPKHRQAIATAARREDVKLIILDSLSGACTGGRVSENESGMLRYTRWLGAVARDVGKPVLATHHLRKKSLLDAPGDFSLERLRGSSAITQVSRLVWVLKADVKDPRNLTLGVIKSNLARFPSPLGVHFDEAGALAFGAAQEAQPDPSELEEAVGWLRDTLQHGPMLQREVVDLGQADGIAKRTLERAKAILRIRSVQGSDGWSWSLS